VETAEWSFPANAPPLALLPPAGTFSGVSATLRERLVLERYGSSTYAKVFLPAGSLPLGKSVPVTVEVGGKRFKTRGWSFTSGAGVTLPLRIVRELGLHPGQMVDLTLLD
jgi:hypothetical protein